MTMDLLDHLMDRYGNITYIHIKNNKKSIDISQPINVYFKQIEDPVQFVDNGKMMYTTKHILQMVCHSTLATVLYSDKMKAWRQKEVRYKT